MDNEYNTKSLSDVLKLFKDKKGLSDGLNQLEVKRAWAEQMGPAIEKHTLKTHLKKDTLFVRLDSSVLREELSYGKTKIINNLNENLGKELIKKIVLS
jgi:predicted nucleic acid-binding Zn ribbon protein